MRRIFGLATFFVAVLLMVSSFFVQGPVAKAADIQPTQIENADQQYTVDFSIVISEETNEIPLPMAEIEIDEGDTVLDALIKATEEYDIELSYIGKDATAYVEGIADVYEFDRGSGSGWMYRVNGIFPNRGAGVIPLVPGDKVEWLYTTNLGQDLDADLDSFRDNIEPAIHVEGLTDQETVFESELSFQLEAKSYFGTALLPTVKVNDGEIPFLDGNDVSVELQEGENIIEITAIDKADRTNIQTYTIIYEKIEEPASPASENNDENSAELPNLIESAIENAISFIIEKGVRSEWEAIGIVQAGKEVPQDYVDVFYQNVEDQITNQLESGRIKITDIERLAMAAVAIGLDPQNINGHNLIELIYNSPERRGGFDTMTFQGNNGPIFALIALDTLNFTVPDHAKWTRQHLIDELLRTQNDDGSWALNEMFGVPSVDITGMALIGLSPYKDQPVVREALDRTVEWLSSMQGENGGFDGGDFVGGITSEATSQVIIGLTAYGIDPAGEKFTKNGISLLAHLLTFQNPDGGFKHTMDYDKSDSMATEQALQALVAYDYFLKGKGSLYQFYKNDETEPGDNEVTPGDDEENEGSEETPGDNEENEGTEEMPENNNEPDLFTVISEPT